MDYKAVIFDFDYTLGDSTVAIATGFRKGMEAMGHPAPTVEQVRPTIGMTLHNAYTLLTGDTDEGNRQQFFEQFQDTVGQRAIQRGIKTMIHETRLFPGAAELLSALKGAGIPAAIVSTKLRSTIEEIFDYQGRGDLLTLVVGGEDVTRAKPDPQGTIAALERLGLKGEEVLYCGDTVIDAQTALAAGAPFCAVLNGTTSAEEFEPLPHVHIAPDLWELKAWLGL